MQKQRKETWRHLVLYGADIEGARNARGQDKQQISPEWEWQSLVKLGAGRVSMGSYARGDRTCSLVPSHGNLNQCFSFIFQHYKKQLGFHCCC